MHQKKPSILIADDYVYNIELLEVMLGQDYELLFARTGQDVLTLASAEAPDLILLDVVMPDLDGYDVCRRLKADPALANIPVIFVTALNQEDDEVRGLSLGAIDYITKPLNFAIVQARVRNLLALRRQRPTRSL